MTADIHKLGGVILGVSLDSLASHRKFAAKFHIPFPLLSDSGRRITSKYGVDTAGGYARRVTFVIDRKGVIAKVFPDVRISGHAKQVLAVLRSLPKH